MPQHALRALWTIGIRPQHSAIFNVFTLPLKITDLSRSLWLKNKESVQKIEMYARIEKLSGSVVAQILAPVCQAMWLIWVCV